MINRIESVFSGFKVVEKIGSGSVGDVYKIESETEGVAAVKVISVPNDNNKTESLLNQGYTREQIGAFYGGYAQNVINTYSRMAELGTHPNVVHCDAPLCFRGADNLGYDIFVKMEYVTPLTKIINGEFGEEQIVNLAKDITNALVLCGNRNILHKDIKPQNLFVGANGKFKLGDIGVAEFSENTQTFAFKPSPDYAAPEMFSGTVAPNSDIYSLGLVLYWLLNNKKAPFVQSAGKVPTVKEKMEARQRRLSGEALPMPENGSEWFKNVLSKACAFDTKIRYANASELLADLRGANSAPVANSDDEATIGMYGTSSKLVQDDDEKTMGMYGKAAVNPISEISDAEWDKTMSMYGGISSGTEEQSKTVKEENVAPPAPAPAPAPKAEPKKVKTKVKQKTEKPKKKKGKGIALAIIGVLSVLLVLVLLVVVLVAALFLGFSNRTGWEEKDGVKQYYLDGKLANDGWLTIEGSNYYFYDDGSFAVGETVIDGVHYRFENDGKMITGAFNKTHYYDSDGKAHQGWLDYNGYKYYCDATGKFVTGLQSINGESYYFNEFGNPTGGWRTFGDESYYFDENGKASVGINVIGGTEYGFSENGVLLKGIQTVNGENYYFDKNGVLTTGFIEVDGKTYYFNKAMVVGEVEKSKDVFYRFGSDGAMVIGFYNDGGNIYHYGSNGAATSRGWFTVDGKRYFSCDAHGKIAKNTKATLDNAFYYFGENGVMATGEVMIDGHKYVYGTNGKLEYKVEYKTENNNTYATEYYYGGGIKLIYRTETENDISADFGDDSVRIDRISYKYKELEKAAENCTGITMRLEIIKYDTLPLGNHAIYVRSNGSWKYVGAITVKAGEKVYNVDLTFNTPVTFDAYTIVYPKSGYSFKYYASNYKLRIYEN